MNLTLLHIQIMGPLGFTCIAIATAIFFVQYDNFDGNMLAASALVPGVAMAASFVLSWLVLKKNAKSAKTVAFETASQNTAMAVTFISVSFRGEELRELLPPATFGGHFVLAWVILVVVIYRVVKLTRRKSKNLAQGNEKSRKEAENHVESCETNKAPQVIEVTRF